MIMREKHTYKYFTSVTQMRHIGESEDFPDSNCEIAKFANVPTRAKLACDIS